MNRVVSDETGVSKVVSNVSSGIAQARRLVLSLTLFALSIVLAGCSASDSVAPGSTPTAGSSSAAAAGPTEQYTKFDQEVSQLLQRQAAWRSPKQISVGDTARVGLVIGDPGLLKSEIAQLVPRTNSTPAGTVQVGSTITVQLYADPGDASITPNAAVNKSMGEHTALLWTWDVHPVHPNSGLLLTAQIDTNMSNGYVQDEELSLTIPVNRTFQYTANEVFQNWATWTAIVAALAATVTWIQKRRKKQPQETPPEAQAKTEQTGESTAK